MSSDKGEFSKIRESYAKLLKQIKPKTFCPDVREYERIKLKCFNGMLNDDNLVHEKKLKIAGEYIKDIERLLEQHGTNDAKKDNSKKKVCVDCALI